MTGFDLKTGFALIFHDMQDEHMQDGDVQDDMQDEDANGVKCQR